jgi:hypothetical protein
VGGVDVVCELISEGEFEEMIPEQCKPLAPKEACIEMLKANRLICLMKEKCDIASQLEKTSMTCALVDVESEWEPILAEMLGVTSYPVFVMDGKVTDIETIAKQQPAVSHESMDQKLKRLTT